MTSQMRTVLLAGSLAVNAILAGGVVWLQGKAAGSVTDALAGCADASVVFQREVLADLESGDASRIEAARSKLRTSIDANARISYKARTGTSFP